MAEQFSRAPAALVEIAGIELDHLQDTIRRVLAISHSIGLDALTFQNAQRYERIYGFDPPDAILYSSIISDLRGDDTKKPKCFISRNSKHFGYTDIEQELRTFGCRYIERYEAALNFLRGPDIH